MWLFLVGSPLVGGLIVLGLLRCYFRLVTVHGDSMYPTFTNGDRLLCSMLWPRLWLQKGRIVVGKLDLQALSVHTDLTVDMGKAALLHPLARSIVDECGDEEITLDIKSDKFVKRIIGMPGDTISIPLESLHPFMQALLRSRSNAEGNLVWQIPEKHCFIRGDGLVSTDSLLLGPVPLSSITGIVILQLPSQRLEEQQYSDQVLLRNE